MSPGPARRPGARDAATWLACATLWAAGAPARTAETGPATSLSIAVESGRLTLDARDVPLAEVLRAIGARTGISVVLTGDLRQTVDRRFTGVALEQALREIARGSVLVLVYGHAGGAAAGWPREIRAYGTVDETPSVRARTAAMLRELRRIRDTAARSVAARMLAVGGDRRAAAAALGEVLAGDRDRQVRASAVEALRDLGGDDGAAALRKGLADRDDSIRASVVSALGALGDERSLAGLGPLLSGDPDPVVRALAVHGLARDGGGVARSLLRAAARDPHPLVRDAARRALGLD